MVSRESVAVQPPMAKYTNGQHPLSIPRIWYGQVRGARLQVAGAGEDGVEAGGVARGGRGANNIPGSGNFVLADQPRQAARWVVRLQQEARRVRIVALRKFQYSFFKFKCRILNSKLMTGVGHVVEQSVHGMQAVCTRPHGELN